MRVSRATHLAAILIACSILPCVAGAITVSSMPASPWRSGSPGMILPADTLARDVAIWDGPGGAEAGHARIGRMHIGTDVTVTETRLLASALWLAIVAVRADTLSGWVSEDDVAPRPGTGVEAAASAVHEEEPAKPPWVAPRAITMLSASGFGIVPTIEEAVPAVVPPLNQEYDEGGFMVSLVHLWRAGGVALGPSIDYGVMNGTPPFDFLSANRLDIPISSKLQILDFGLRFGQYLSIGSGEAVFHYGLGPTVSLVKQDSRMRFETLDPSDGSVVEVGERTESLSRWRFGGDLAFGLGWRVKRDFRVGFTVRGFAIPWESRQEQSLTLDFIDHQTLVGGSAGVTFGYEYH